MRPRINSVTRHRLKMQGFVSCDDKELRIIRPWLRVGPAICGIWVAAGLFLQSPLTLWALVPFAALGAILPVHPFDVVYNFGVRRWKGTPRIPSYGSPRRFACVVAALWLAGTAIVLGKGYVTLALVFGGVFLISPITYVTTDFCMLSWAYQRVKRPTASSRVTAATVELKLSNLN